MNRLLLAMYPRRWRERYGAEVAALVDELVSAGETTPLRAVLDLVAGAAVERCRAMARREVVRFVVVAGVVAGGVALAVCRGRTGAGATRPYFATHRVGALLLAAELAWLVMELAEWRRGRALRRAETRGARGAQLGFGLTVGACAVAATVSANAGPALVPAAAIQPGVVAFTVGVVMLVAGLCLRGWSFAALRGRYLNFRVAVTANHPVLTVGPYRLLRHPGSAGMLMICAGFGLTSANWAGVTAMTLVPLPVIVWGIRREERLLLESAGDLYRRYARDRKRLVPLIW